MNSPNGWAMLDDMAKNVSEALNKKSITPEDELVIALDDMAHDIALIESNHTDWLGCNMVKTSNEWRSVCLHQFPKLTNRTC